MTDIKIKNVTANSKKAGADDLKRMDEIARRAEAEGARYDAIMHPEKNTRTQAAASTGRNNRSIKGSVADKDLIILQLYLSIEQSMKDAARGKLK